MDNVLHGSVPAFAPEHIQKWRISVIKARPFYRAIVELIVLASIAWIISILIEPDPQGVNVVRFGLKWFVYTYSMAAIVSVLMPFVPAFAIGALVSRIALHKTDYWQIYRIAGHHRSNISMGTLQGALTENPPDFWARLTSGMTTEVD